MAKRVWMGLVVSALMLAAGMGTAQAGNIVVNGGFETGDLSGWATNNIGTPTSTCAAGDRDWNVSSSSSTGCLPVESPVGGSYAAYVINDGTGPLDYTLTQTIMDPLGLTSALLSFQWTSNNSYDNGRMLNVLIDGVNVFSDSTFGSFGWTNETINVAGVLAAHEGQPITLEFDNYIPHTWTGPAGMGLDNVALNVTTTGVPEPSSVALFGVALAGLALARRKMG